MFLLRGLTTGHYVYEVLNITVMEIVKARARHGGQPIILTYGRRQ